MSSGSDARRRFRSSTRRLWALCQSAGSAAASGNIVSTTEPAAAQPANAQPANAQPATAQPATAQPATAQPGPGLLWIVLIALLVMPAAAFAVLALLRRQQGK